MLDGTSDMLGMVNAHPGGIGRTRFTSPGTSAPRRGPCCAVSYVTAASLAVTWLPGRVFPGSRSAGSSADPYPGDIVLSPRAAPCGPCVPQADISA